MQNYCIQKFDEVKNVKLVLGSPLRENHTAGLTWGDEYKGNQDSSLPADERLPAGCDDGTFVQFSCCRLDVLW